jgi:methylated-DNA-[protein]-cysteine S-methyltransferase
VKEIYCDFYKAPFCILKISANDKGVFLIEFVKKTGRAKENKITKIAKKEIDGYFNNKIKVFNFPIDLNLSGFQKLVYNYIKKIPYGQVKTYKDVAKGIGKKKASRAVGQALGRNPLPLYFPCHRIVKSDGTLGGFSGGKNLKENLIKMEGIKLNELNNKFV